MYPIPTSSKLSIRRGPGQRLTYIMSLEAQQIPSLWFVIVAEDTEHYREVLCVHLVPLAMRCDAVEVK